MIAIIEPIFFPDIICGVGHLLIHYYQVEFAPPLQTIF